MKKKESKSEQQDNRLYHVILVTTLTATLLVTFIGFGYGIGTQKIVKTMQQRITEVEAKSNKAYTVSIKSKLVQNLYNEVTTDTNEESLMWEFDSKDKKTITLNILGRNLNDRKAHVLTENINYPAYNGYEQVQNPKYFTKNEVESVYRSIYGYEAELDTSKNINIMKNGAAIYHYDETTNNYYPYQKSNEEISLTESETRTIQKAVVKGKSLKIYQKVEYKNYTDSSKNSNYQYVYSFEKESDGMYKFIKRIKQ